MGKGGIIMLKKLEILEIVKPEGYKEGEYCRRWKTFYLKVREDGHIRTMVLSVPAYEEFILQQELLARGADGELLEKLCESSHLRGVLEESDNHAGDDL